MEVCFWPDKPYFSGLSLHPCHTCRWGGVQSSSPLICSAFWGKDASSSIHAVRRDFPQSSMAGHVHAFGSPCCLICMKFASGEGNDVGHGLVTFVSATAVLLQQQPFHAQTETVANSARKEAAKKIEKARLLGWRLCRILYVKSIRFLKPHWSKTCTLSLFSNCIW